jgi:hypothetical protein
MSFKISAHSSLLWEINHYCNKHIYVSATQSVIKTYLCNYIPYVFSHPFSYKPGNIIRNLLFRGLFNNASLTVTDI